MRRHGESSFEFRQWSEFEGKRTQLWLNLGDDQEEFKEEVKREFKKRGILADAT